MLIQKRSWIVLLSLLVVMGAAWPALAENSELSSNVSLDRVDSFRLAPALQDESEGSEADASSEEIWTIEGPVRMRSADPLETGELEFKNIFKYGTSSDESDDDFEYELEIEWGFAPDHELIFDLPVEFGDGDVEGNADITLGWHWRLWQEQECLPAFAMRNYVRLPSGVDSDGVDYELRGLFTKSIIADRCRLHFNPFLKVNGGEDGDERDFEWGLLVGTDGRLADNLILNLAYIYSSSEEYGHRDQHAAEIGLEWEMAENHTLALATSVGLDGDDEGDNWSFAVSYIISLDNAPILWR